MRPNWQLVTDCCWFFLFLSSFLALGFNLQLVAGSDNGILTLFDIEHGQSSSVTFDKFELLTSVHVNSTDELILASGYSRNVGLYDISSGKCLQVFTDMHQEHINVVKFSNHSPTIFATSSFDRDIKLWDLRQNQTRACYTSSSSRGNVMVCFSPDDHHLLVSAVDNEVSTHRKYMYKISFRFSYAH